MSQTLVPKMPDDSNDPEIVRKPWVALKIIVSETRGTEAHVTRFTDGTSSPGGVLYGS